MLLNHFCSLRPIVYIKGSEHVNDLLGGNQTLQPARVSQPDGPIIGGANATTLGGSLPGRS